MEGKDAIIARIIGDAENRANVLLSEAEKSVSESMKDAEDWAENYKNTQRALLKEETEHLVSRRKTVAQLDCRKAMLRAKQEVIGAVFSRAQEKACSFGKEKYLAVIERLLTENAEEGDCVLLAESAPFGEAELMNLPVAKERKLKFGGKGDFAGGVYLTNDVSDKDLSFAAVIGARKDEMEAEIAKSMFPQP